MHSFQNVFQRAASLLLALALCAGAGFAQQQGALRGQVVDQFGGAIIGATVKLINERGGERTATTNQEGYYTIAGLAPGSYTVRATATGFAIYRNASVRIAAGERALLNLRLGVAITEAEVAVADEAAVSAEPDKNASAIVLRGQDLDALPQDPDDLADALRALAGPAAGPNGGQIFVDGFTGGRVPPRDSIREVRINSNPFSAEYDRLGFGRIEIFTRPGTDKLHGQAFFNFNDESLNARDPFAPNRAPYQSRLFGGNLSGPIRARRASYFLDFEKRDIDDNAIINATILNGNLAPSPFALAVLTPQRRTTFSPRLDYAINRNHTLIGRYSFTRSERLLSGIGNFDLLSRAFDRTSAEHNIQLSETAILNPRTINETRLQFTRSLSEQAGDNSVPAIRVLDAFTGGGAQVGLARNLENRWEMSNHTSMALGNHAVKFGARLRGVRLTDLSPGNFGGTFIFAGGLAPQLDANNQIVRGASGDVVLAPITSLERYRRTLLFRQQGLTGAQIRALGGGATQFNIAGGNPEARVSQWDFGGFVQDDWR
ncbi:MAG: carboxypeptidase regulatory-like domain-containing protein, partial [Blastocatellia bacterium]